MNSLDILRKKINDVDEQLLILLAKRLEIVKAIGEEKNRIGKPVHDTIREQDVINQLVEKGKSLGLSRETIEKIWMTFFKIAYIIEEKNE